MPQKLKCSCRLFELRFYCVTLHYKSGSWSCYFPRDFGGLEFKKKKKSLHQSTCPWLVFSFGKILFPSRASSEIHLHFNSAVCCPCHGPAFWVLLRVAGAFSFFPMSSYKPVLIRPISTSTPIPYTPALHSLEELSTSCGASKSVSKPTADAGSDGEWLYWISVN